MTAPRPGEAKPGDVVSWWHDSGAFGVSPCYATVISGRTMLTIRSEFGQLGRKHVDFFTRGIITGRELDDFRAETIDGIRPGYATEEGEQMSNTRHDKADPLAGRQEYKVRGRWPFPADMLRRDHAEPATEGDRNHVRALTADIAETHESATNMHEIKLVRTQRNKWDAPNFERWASFGWRVVPESLPEHLRPLPKLPEAAGYTNRYQRVACVSYPNADLLPFDPEKGADVAAAVAARATGNTLFDFVFIELGEPGINRAEALRRLDKARDELAEVRAAIGKAFPSRAELIEAAERAREHLSEAELQPEKSERRLSVLRMHVRQAERHIVEFDAEAAEKAE